MENYNFFVFVSDVTSPEWDELINIDKKINQLGFGKISFVTFLYFALKVSILVSYKFSELRYVRSLLARTNFWLR